MAEPNTWRPFPKQEYLLALPDSIFEALYGGAAGGGKSELLLLLPLVRRFYEHPKFKGLILRRTFPELEREIIRRAYDFYPSCGAVPTDNGKTWKFPSGAYMDFGHAEYEEDVRKYDTSQYNYIGFDELTSFTQGQYKYLSYTRCRSASHELPAIVRSAATPGGIGHGWVRKYLVEPCKEGFKILIDKNTGMKRIFVPAKVTDNPYMIKNDPTYVRRLEMLPEAEKRAKLYGDWWTFSGQVFEDFRTEPLPDEPENARHVLGIDEIKIPDYCPHIISIDWGYSAMLWAGFAAILPNKRIHIYREYASTREKISTWATEVGKIADPIKDKLIRVVLCRSAWQNRGDDKTIAQQFQEYSGLTPYQPDQDRVTGKLLLQEFLRWKSKPTRKTVSGTFDPLLADKILRIKGQDSHREYCSQFESELPETNLPKLTMSKQCVELIRALPLCVYDKDNIEDVAEFEGDDPYDGCRYLVQAAQRFFERSEKSQENLLARQKILQEFESKKDMHSFYMQLRLLESKDKPHRGVRLIH